MRRLLAVEDLEFLDIDPGGPRRGADKDVLRLEGSHTNVRRLQARRARDGLQRGRREGLVHVVLCHGGSGGGDEAARRKTTRQHTDDGFPLVLA